MLKYPGPIRHNLWGSKIILLIELAFTECLLCTSPSSEYITFSAPNNPMKHVEENWLPSSPDPHLFVVVLGTSVPTDWGSLAFPWKWAGGSKAQCTYLAWVDGPIDANTPFPKLNCVAVALTKIITVQKNQWNRYCVLFTSVASENCLQDVPKPQTMLKEELIAVQATDLSAREFVVYQYGLSILDLLTPQLQVNLVSCLSMEQSSCSQEGQGDHEGGFQAVDIP